MLSVWQRTIVDSSGNVIPDAEVTVKIAGTETLADLFSDESGSTPITNPFNAGSNGFARFYVGGGTYDISASGASSTGEWQNVVIAALGDQGEHDSPSNAEKIARLDRMAAATDRAYSKTVGRGGPQVPTNADRIAQSVTALRALDPTNFDADTTVNLLGYSTPGDGGGGTLCWDASSTETDNGGTIFKPDSIDAADPGRWKRSIPQMSASVPAQAFGVVPDDPSVDNLSALETAAEVCAEAGVELLIPENTYIQGTWVPPNNLHFRGPGREVTAITAPDDLARHITLVLVGYGGYPRSGVVMRDFKVDFNSARWGLENDSSASDAWSAIYGEDNNQSAIVFSNAANCFAEKVEGSWGRKHSINIAGASNERGDSDPLKYNDEPSRFIYLTDCVGSFAGDDCITTHMCSDIWLTRCIGRDAQAELVGNSNAIEIDDGSRNIHIHDCAGFRCNKGLEIKGHDDTPAPYNVFVTGTFTAINNARNLHIDHIGHGGSDPESATARAVRIERFVSIAPKQYKPEFTGSIGHYRIIAYEDVEIQSILMSAGGEDITNKEIEVGDSMTGQRLGHIFNGARKTRISHTRIIGNPEADYGIDVAASAGGDHWFGHLEVEDGQDEVIRFASGAGTCWLMSYNIKGDHPNSTAIRASGTASLSDFKYIGPGLVDGYEFAIRWNNASYADPVICSPISTETPS